MLVVGDDETIRTTVVAAEALEGYEPVACATLRPSQAAPGPWQAGNSSVAGPVGAQATNSDVWHLQPNRRLTCSALELGHQLRRLGAAAPSSERPDATGGLFPA